jgi:nicotinamidase-related amidase
MDKLDPSTTALVLIDLQKGIAPYAGGPYTSQQVFERGGRLAARFRELKSPVVLVRVGWSADGGDAPRQPVDAAAGGGGPLPADWWDFAEELAVADSDILVTKRQWGAFYGTELDLHLRRRSVTTVVIGGIATNIGVESTARAAHEHGYHVVLVEDATTGRSADMHAFAFEHIFPLLARMAATDDIALQA